MSPRATDQVQARKLARERLAAANEARDRKDAQELELAADFESARRRRIKAAEAVLAIDVELGQIADKLAELGCKPDRIAVLTGQDEAEVRRLRKAAAETLAGGNGSASRAAAPAVSATRPVANGPAVPDFQAGAGQARPVQMAETAAQG